MNDVNFKTPEEQIEYTRNFLRELANVQELYFNTLVNSLTLTEEGEICLHDYIYNSDEQDGFISFPEYMEYYGKTKSDLFL